MKEKIRDSFNLEYYERGHCLCLSQKLSEK